MRNNLATLVGNLAFLDEIYARYQISHADVDPSFATLFQSESAVSAIPVEDAGRLMGVSALVHAFRTLGHLEADLDPLGLLEREPHPELDPATYGFGHADMDMVVPTGGFHGERELPLGKLLEKLRTTYCGSIGLEFTHISSLEPKAWLAARMEETLGKPQFSLSKRKSILRLLAEAEAFERFLHWKYVGTKRFSLDGSETLIPALDCVLEAAGDLGVEEVVIGMSHRGRLNVLVHTLGKRARDLFAEFEDIAPGATLGGGDVKYHLGYSLDHVTSSGKKLHLSLAFNPSHLEVVDPVVVGRVRAKQRRHRDYKHQKVMGLLLHGDAAFAGQGLVPETLNLAQIHGYRTGGTFHVIVNNQIGFTASPHESRSTPYPTDVAKMIECPIFHVNAEDPEAVAHVIQLASEYRARFANDVVVDMFCFRRFGHNEADEPSFTHPIMYRRIEEKKSVFHIHTERLVGEGIVTAEEAQAMGQRYTESLEREFAAAKNVTSRPEVEAMGGVWQGYVGGVEAQVPDIVTGVSHERLLEVARVGTRVPEGFNLHAKIKRLFAQRVAMVKGAQPLDWGTGEMLAFGTLVQEGFMVRLSGQDSGRGTFSHRHASVTDTETGKEFIPLQRFPETSGDFRVYDSPLSEAAVLGCEFGYALDYPDGLVIWEAQFGDFANGAQVILDQFVASSEDKWKRLCGLTMFLPHGYEGQGPEHSSARFERFLQLAAEDNIQVVQPTTPAQIFHVLRRQVVRKWRKPLVVLTPKSLLRLPAATSKIEDFTTGTFQRILGDPSVPAATRLVLCSGKIYYELVAERQKRGDEKTAIARLEQLYPWRPEEVTRLLATYPKLDEVIWVQDEPANMGAYYFVELRLLPLVGKKKFRAVTRAESASPATGSHRAHGIEQRDLLDRTFGA